MTESDLLKHNYHNGGNNYILLGNTKWIGFTKNVIYNKLMPKYGNNFNLIVYWHNASNTKEVDYICVPYSAVSHLLIDEHLTGRNTSRERWTFIIKDNLFCVHANTNFSVDITPYLNCFSEYNKSLLIENTGAEEGNKKYVLHQSIERNATLVNNLKLRRKQADPMLWCEICGFSFIEKYGDLGDGFIEAHHKIPLSSLKESTITRERDLILVCSNCHRMLHRANSSITIQALISRIAK